MTITLKPSVDSPQFLGTTVVWTATVQGGQQGRAYDYQFAISRQGQTQITRDFALRRTLIWVPYQVEGTYQVTVTVRDVTKQPYITYPGRRLRADVNGDLNNGHSGTSRWRRIGDARGGGGGRGRRGVCPGHRGG